MWHIYFIMWVAWSWKWTLISNFKKINFDNVLFPISYKTRPIRETEINWIDSWFISREDFFSWVQSWEFLEYALVHNLDYCWTKFKDVIDNWVKLWFKVIKELDINWLEELLKNRQDLNWLYTTIFLNIPTDVLIKRIEKRGAFMSSEELALRIDSAIMEEKKAREICDYIIDARKTETEVLDEFLKIINN